MKLLFIALVSSILVLNALGDDEPDCSKRPKGFHPHEITQCINGPKIFPKLSTAYKDECEEEFSALGKKGPHHSKQKRESFNDDEEETKKPPHPPPHPPPHGGPGHGRGMKKGFEAMNCAMECVLNQTKMIADGKFNKENANKFVDEVIDDDEFGPIIKAALPECFKNTTEILKDYEPKEDMKCGVFAPHLLGCVNNAAIIKCPEDRWVDSEHCDTLKNYVSKCGLNFKPPHRPPPPPHSDEE